MKISRRQKKIIEALLRAEGGLSAGELAQAAGVSARTVHRELADIESVLSDVGVALQKKAGAGMRLDADPERLASLARILDHAESGELSATDRRTLLFCELLSQAEPVKLFALASELQVAIPTVASDLDWLERWAARDGLAIVRRRGYGVQLEGSESGKRNAVSRLALETLDDSELFGRPETDGRPLHPVTAKLFELIGKPSFFRLEQALWTLEEADAKEQSETAYTKKLVRLSVALARFRAGRRIEPAAARPSVDPAPAEALARELGVELPPEETAYLAAVLASEEEEAGDDALAPPNPRLVELTTSLVRGVERRMNAPLSGDRQLREGLLKHLESALPRMLEGVPIRNPLLSQIKKDYEELFRSVKEAANEAMGEMAAPDEEIGYLAMHFGAALERAKQLPVAVRALLVCTSGIGSSKMLAVRLAKEFPQVRVVGNVSWYEAAHTPEERYDLIVSTVDLPLPPERYVKLSPLLNEGETERLRNALLRLAAPAETKASPASEPASAGAEPLERLRAAKQYADGALRLLERFIVRPLRSEGKTVRELLLEACLHTIGADRAEEATARLLERESQGSLLIPDSSLALFHARSEAVEAPALALFPLSRGIDIGADRPVSRMMLMLAPKRLPKRELELLSEISAMLLQPDFIETLQEGDERRIARSIAARLENYISNHIEWSE